MTKSALVTLLSIPIMTAAGGQSFTRILEGDLAKDTGLYYGCAWGDYDNDGYPDLVVASSWNRVSQLYHNNRDGTLSRVTESTIPTARGDCGAPVWGDYDNDGDLDLFISNDFGADIFYRNEGDGHFRRVTYGAWVTDSGSGIGAAWADYDKDGFLDVYVANNMLENNCLYRNNGDGTMTKITKGDPVQSGGYSHGCTWADYDGDGDLDLFVANTNSQDQQFRNNGDGTFTRVTLYKSTNVIHAAVSCADYDNDGDLDVLLTGCQKGNPNHLYRNDGAKGFTPVEVSGLKSGLAFGHAWGDYDSDGYLDFYVANYDSFSKKAQANSLFHNNGDGTFTQVTQGPPVQDLERSAGCAWADYDSDGDLDLFVVNGCANTGPDLQPEASALYRNDGGTNSWIVLRLVGTASNRSAIGAKVRVLATIGGKSFWQLREISGGSGLCSQNDLRAHFGLGDAQTAETVRIEWPSGIVQELNNVAARQFLTITEQQLGPTSPPLLGVTTISNAILMTLTGETNRLYVFECSTNLVQWTKLAVRTNLTGCVECTVQNSTAKFPMRYFRAVVP